MSLQSNRQISFSDINKNLYVSNGNMSIDFIATNGDGSICYIRSVDLGGYNKVIINGKTYNIPSRNRGFLGMTITHIGNSAKKFNLEKTRYSKKRVK